jgi:hypothetical protein
LNEPQLIVPAPAKSANGCLGTILKRDTVGNSQYNARINRKRSCRAIANTIEPMVASALQ